MIIIYTWKDYHASAMFEIIQSQRVMEIWVGINAFEYGISKINITIITISKLMYIYTRDFS